MARHTRPKIQRSSHTGRKEICNTYKGLFSMLNSKFFPQHSETIISPKNCKLSRQGSKMQRNG